MGETLFCIDRQNRHECQARYRGEREQEYYRGDFWIEDAARVEVTAERKPIGPISIIRQRSATNLFFRRTRQHIRDDSTDLSILWFLKYGRISFGSHTSTKAIGPGGFAITRSTEPFFMECKVDADLVHEVLHVTVPTHVLRGRIPCERMSGPIVPRRRAELTIAGNIFTDIFEDEGRLGEESARLLVDTALALVGEALRDEELLPARQSITECRQRDIKRFIEVNLSNPRLSGKMVAQGCGVSPRYLSSLLYMMGTSFSQLVWAQRLEKAKQLLASEELLDNTIAEIGYSLGFKSPAHFSRKFKRTFNLNPRDYRIACHGNERVPDRPTLPSS